MNALLIKLLNMSAAGSVLILAVVVLRAVLKKAPRWIICVMWALVAIRLICPISIASPVSAFRATPSIVSESGEVQVFRPAGGSEKPLLAVDTVQIERPRTSSESIREIPGTELAVTQRSRDTYLPPLVQAYLLGLNAMLLYAMVSTLLLRKRVAASLRQRGNIRICDEVESPFILGIARPVIYLPSSLSEEEKRFVLAHERAHLRRLDHIWKPLGFLILSVHWFNPFCWLAYVLLCRDIELACDEKVIRELGRAERAAYSQTLLNCSAHRILAACPVAFGETDVKTRVKAVLNYKKPALWIILSAVLACVVLIVCFAADPMQKQDLSFLNYKNAIPLIGQNDTAPYANLYPADSDGVQPGVADSKALAQLLESAEWTKRRAPSSSPEPRGYLEFVIEDDYRIIVYQSEHLAAVRFGNDIRYYRTGAGDYEAALATFIPAPSTEPDRPPEQSALPTPVPPPSLPEIDAGIVPADPEAFLLGFADAEIVSIYDEFSREYAAPDKSFTEIISAETWTAHAFNEFPASIALRLIVMRSGDWELRIEDDGEDCLFAAYAVGRSASDPIIFFDCGENLMDDLMAWAITRQDGAHSGPMPYELTAEEEERIVYMLSEVGGKTGTYALSDYTGGDMNAVPELCMQLQAYAHDHRLSADQIRGLMLGTQGLDGAYAEAFSGLLAELHGLDPLCFVAAYFQADESVQAFLWELYGNLDHIYPPEELAREYAAFSQIYNNMTAYLRTEYGLKYENLAPKLEDMQLYRCASMPTEPVEWFFEGVVPEWAVQVILDHAGNSKLAVGVLTVYFGSPDEYTDDLPLGAYLKNTPESASAARLAVRLNDSSLAYLTVPAELAGRIERKIETGSELPGISRVRMDGWGEQYAQGIDVPDLYYYPAYDRDRSAYLTILRNADGQYGIGGWEADEEIRALLTLLQRETGWNVFADPGDFAELTQIEVFFCGTLLTTVRDEAHLDAFEELISEGSFASYASKTPNEIVEIRCTRADGSVVTLAADPEAARFWLPPFSYYRYDAYEQEPRTGALLKALGLEGWPSMDTVDHAAVREMNERLLPTPEGW
ncbi:MAG: hypothetical protein IJL51_07195 [Oscillospiraceae bacterium]|nr:hypothetical protein [Oscillospiraceae bacterium]